MHSHNPNQIIFDRRIHSALDSTAKWSKIAVAILFAAFVAYLVSVNVASAKSDNYKSVRNCIATAHQFHRDPSQCPSHPYTLN